MDQSKPWASCHILHGSGEPFIVRHVPEGLKRGENKLPDLSLLSKSQVRELNSAHELGHALVYLHFGMPVCIRMTEVGDSAASVSRWPGFSGELTDDAFRLGFAAGEVAGVKWLKKNGLHTPIEEYIQEILAFSDRKVLRDDFGVTFGTGGGNDYDELASRADLIIEEGWSKISSAASLVAQKSWIGWDEVSEILGFPEVVTSEMREVSEGIRRGFRDGEGVHAYILSKGGISVRMGNHDWLEYAYEAFPESREIGGVA